MKVARAHGEELAGTAAREKARAHQVAQIRGAGVLEPLRLVHRQPSQSAESAERNFFNRDQASREGTLPAACAWFRQALRVLITRFSDTLRRRCRSAAHPASEGRGCVDLAASPFLAFRALRRRQSAQASHASKSEDFRSATRFSPSCGST